ncbi:hypothetical protein PUN28_015783 [Cardiocondyla obscurior]|uniref:Reverse transcriptase domain-containing protein n=1 Tax=Cardiocondyla obscurior TaxID=286306 RepID=A0AAW2EZN0_9HYME
MAKREEEQPYLSNRRSNIMNYKNIKQERGNLVISAVYCPPRYLNSQKQFEDFFSTLGERFIVGGDFNAKHTHWGSRIPLINNEQLDEAAEQLTKAIQQAAWDATPPTTEKDICKSNYPIEVRELVKEKRLARKRWQETRDPEDKTVANRLSQQLKRLLHKVKNENINFYLKNLTNSKESEYSLWKATRKLKRPKIYNPPIRRSDNTWARDNRSKAEAFADHLEKTFQPVENLEDNREIQIELNSDVRKIQPISTKETKCTIDKDMNLKKAPGYELITVRILKELSQKAINFITYLFNAAIRLKYFPLSWKVAQITMIPKPGKSENEIASYRPISLLPTISKLFEKLLLKRIIPIMEQAQLIPQHQFGFRRNHSTIDQVHRVTHIIEKALEEGKYCPAVFLDVAQAFDKRLLSAVKIISYR